MIEYKYEGYEGSEKGVMTKAVGLTKADLKDYVINAQGFIDLRRDNSNSQSLEQLVGHITLSELVKHFIVFIEVDTKYPGQTPYAYVDDDKMSGHTGLAPWDIGQCLDCKAVGGIVFEANSGKVLIAVIPEVNASPFSYGGKDNVTLGALPLCGTHLYIHAKKALAGGEVESDPILEHLYVAAAINVLQGTW